ncbi:MAG: D-alanyl-D-alanine carboxypeptidase [Verrucomicrobia bacterium]|nr:D-alanyl-D-alanine carboxypeptidase [Verrucomicrobiota bacterium]
MILPRFAFLFLSLLVPLAASTRSKPTRPDTSDLGTYKGAIVTDAATGAVLFESNPDVVTPPASMTKLMTYAVLHDKLAAGALTLGTPVTVSAADSRIGGTQVYLIHSANDAAHALAIAAAGSTQAFVELMNAKACALGMNNTTFRSPHGLPPASRRLAEGDLASPRDFAVLCRHLLRETDVLTYTSARVREFGTSRPNGAQRMENHNKLLGKVEGVDGLKTGYTAGAGYCLSATAQRNGRRVIVVIMGSFGKNGEVDKGRTRDLRTADLIEKGFAALPAGSPPFSRSAATTTKPSPASNLSAAPLTTAEKSSAATAEPMIKFSLPAAKKK